MYFYIKNHKKYYTPPAPEIGQIRVYNSLIIDLIICCSVIYIDYLKH